MRGSPLSVAPMTEEENGKGREYYLNERRIFSHLKNAGFNPRAIFDVGSSHAGWSEVVNQVFPDARYYLFEPLVDYKPFFRESCERALAQHPNFSLHKVALGNRNARVWLSSDPEGYGASVLSKVAEPPWLPERIAALMVTLESYAADHALAKPDLLKLDVQGAEMLVLRGAEKILPKVQVIELEAWFSRRYGPDSPLFHELIGYLQGYGFELFELGDAHYADTHQIFHVDAFLAQRELLERWRGRLPPFRLSET